VAGRFLHRRECPIGYIQCDRVKALELYNRGYPITVCGNNVNHMHVFDGWRLGYTFSNNHLNRATWEALNDINDFETRLANYQFYLEPELGTYVVFYVKQSEIEGVS